MKWFNWGVLIFAAWLVASPWLLGYKNINLALWKSLVRVSWPFALLILLTSIYSRIDVVMLSLMSGESAVGFYSSGYRLTETLTLIPAALMLSLFPLMSHYFSSAKEKLRTMHHLAMKYQVMLMLPASVGTALVGGKILMPIYGPQFIGTETGIYLNLSLLVFATLFIFLNYASNYLLNSMNREKLGVAVLVAGVFINIVLNLALIPAHSYIGAAFATVLTELFIFTAFLFIIRRLLYTMRLFSVFARPLAASAVMALPLLALPELDIFLAIPLAALVYFAALYALGGFTHQDRDIIRRIITRA